MSDTFDGGASAPADNAPASNEPVAAPPNPISTEREPAAPEPKTEEPAKPVSTREALQKAAAKVEADSKADPKAKPIDSKAKDAPDAADKPVKSDGPQRDDTGKFAPKEGAEKPAQADAQAKAADVAAKPTNAASDAPARFSPDAKAAWATAPEPVKAEVARMEREMTAGIEKYRAHADKFETIREYAELAEKNGSDIKTALDKYVHLDRLIGQNPIQALEEICQIKGLSLRQVAEHVLGQEPDKQAGQRDQEIIGLKNTIAQLEQRIGGVTSTLQQQHVDKTHEAVKAFAADRPRFDELAPDIAFFIESGRTKDLAEAYSLAERLNPAPASAPEPAPAPAQATRAAAQTRGEKSITGAPTPGSNPAKRQSSSSIREALRNAVANAG